MKVWLTRTAFVLGMLLLLLNITGVIFPRFGESAPPSVTGDRSLATLMRRPAEEDEAYFERLTDELHDLIEHRWPVGPVPARENYVLHLMQYLVPSFKNYEYISHDRAIKRGYGICTQYSLALYDILDGQGYEPKIVQLRRHTFVEVSTTAGQAMILDADYGLVFQMSYEEIASDVSKVAPHYAALDPTDTPDADLTPAQLGDRSLELFSGDPVAVQIDRPTPQTYLVEPVAYGMKWSLPALLLVFSAGLQRFPRSRSSLDTDTA